MRHLGVSYVVINGRTRYIKLDSEDEKKYRARGADLTPLKDIGQRDAREVIRDMLNSIPKNET